MDISQVNNLLAETAELPQQEEKAPPAEANERIDELLQGEGEEEQEEQEQEQEEQEEQEQEQQEELVLQNLSQFADYLNLEAEEMYGIEVPMPNGAEPVTISTLKDEYINSRRERDALEQERQVIRQMQQEIQQQQMQGLPQYSNELLDAEATIRAIDAQYQSIDWDSVEDKGQAALYRQQLNDAKQQMLERREQVLQKQKQEQQQAFTQRAAADWQETIKAIPEWRDNNKVQSDKAKIKVDINEYGFRDEEIFTITDPRVIRMLRDFTLMKEKLNTAGIKAKEVRKRGIAVPNRARNQIPNSQRTALSNKIKRAKKTQDRRDINSAVTDLLNLPEG